MLARKNWRPTLVAGVALLASVSLPVLGTGCGKGAAFAVAAAVPYIPPAYYACTEVAPDDLLYSYFGSYGNIQLAEVRYKDVVFVFKNIIVGERMLLDKAQNILDVSKVKCAGLTDGAVAKLRAGDVIDVVGINRGAPANPLEKGWLSFDSCLFLKAGTVQLPAAGGGVFGPAY